LCKSFTNYGPNKRRSCNWIVSHLRITDFYAKQTAPKLKVEMCIKLVDCRVKFMIPLTYFTYIKFIR